MAPRFPGVFLLAAVFIVAVCGLVYELIAASLSSYLLGGSITQFSIVIGVFLSAMGLGSYLTRYVETRLSDAFVAIQIGIGLSGGLSAAVLLLTFSFLSSYLPVLICVLTVTGTLVGMEIPLLIRILRSHEALRLTVSNVLALDYIGALIASCAFPLLLVPHLGILRTSFLFGLVNVGVSAVAIRVMGHMLKKKRALAVAAGICAAILTVGFIGSGAFTSFTENALYQDNIILVRQTPYQRIVITKWHSDVRMFIDGGLQFSSVDEHRYHEALIHPAMSALPGAARALVLGGGDGMAVRELLKYSHIKSIDLVDLDPEVIGLFREKPLLAGLSNNALSDPRVKVHIQDAGKFLEESEEFWDVIFLDLPDPNTLSLARLYTKSFYKLLSRHLNAGGIAVTQATSPFYAPEAFWCIVKTWEETPLGPEGNGRFHVYPYHAYVPSFGDWGFVMASQRGLDPGMLELEKNVPLKFLNDDVLHSLFLFPQDYKPVRDIAANRLDDQVLVKYYRQGWRRFGS
ncbi:polyamine aminopropyltransferase [Desulfomonile tiedjei]|uniref:Polyamine aminopropyltransferase n=1 Tax=Desulfomonile tiedjei (strain ATCC 49306 / DSM 6799 / DCB-1) TaxID=706587 RepID=I4C3Y5_DESTA|nr:polyamine aminopropyltransferase [Desulfomonile tiedjei]AFM24276.1 putative spermidine synthase with an N-terminal membrane domain [Desulfomonile tiedjei DSM 6799]